ncbi:MAG: T9SS type A sorting domain-containing protein [Bacteroidota bacterium]|nr:T9SS type A sorting domain-containing protein [Bacteroidota bacterium]
MKKLKTNLINKFTSRFLAIVLVCVNGLSLFAQTTPDPGLPGSYAVLTADYDLGDLAYKPPSFPDFVEVRGNVHYPAALSSGPFPVLLFLHGRHSTCYQTSNPSNTALDWPCAPGDQSITSFEGYDYLAQQMASHGYIVISISANGINANDASIPDSGMPARGELVQHHLNLWNTFNTTGAAPFGTMFVGALDMNRIGTMGHSRGGEGVVSNALLNASLGSPYGIKAVLTLAPVDFGRQVMNNIPLLNIAPYCDGDVSNIQGVHYYDDTRYSVLTDQSPKHNILMMGANHNFYNTVWTPGTYIAGTSDDWDDNYGSGDIHCGTGGTGNKRLTPAQQQASFNAYASAFFRVYVGNETAFEPILETDDIIPPVSSLLDSSQVFVSYHAPASERLDVNRTDTEGSELTNTVAGSVSVNSLLVFDICGDDLGEFDCGLSGSSSKEPHSGSSSTLGMSQQEIQWNAPGDYYQNSIPPASQNFSTFQALQFRAAINFDNSTSGSDIDFTIQLIDGTGAISSVIASDYSNFLYFPPGTQFLRLPKVMYNTLKIPLTDFTGVDLNQIQQIKFLFNQTTAAAIFVADIALSGTAPIVTSAGSTTNDPGISVFPNPAESVVTVDLGNNYTSVSAITLFDIQGKLILRNENISSQRMTINLNDLEKGIYILNITGLNDPANFRVVKR